MVASLHCSGTTASTRHIAIKLKMNLNASSMLSKLHISRGDNPSEPAANDLLTRNTALLSSLGHSGSMVSLVVASVAGTSGHGRRDAPWLGDGGEVFN
jgi:hypothetical protein